MKTFHNTIIAKSQFGKLMNRLRICFTRWKFDLPGFRKWCGIGVLFKWSGYVVNCHQSIVQSPEGNLFVCFYKMRI